MRELEQDEFNSSEIYKDDYETIKNDIDVRKEIVKLGLPDSHPGEQQPVGNFLS